jgi:Thymidylate kinase/Radical SAM superfamily
MFRGLPRTANETRHQSTENGGEPTIHPQFTAIVSAFRAAGMGVGVCTNATTLTDSQIGELAMAGGVHVNVSLDGFRADSHGRFRGDRDSFAVTVATVRKLAQAGLLQGLLCTPNSLAEDEYRELCEFAVENGAAYVLMNPLSSMGRGVKSRGRLADSGDLRTTAAPAADAGMSGQVGTLLSIDGPGGSGKSTVAAIAAEMLTGHGLAVHETTEPSRTPLGKLIRAGTDEYTGMALACLVAGDRHHHLAAEIRPALAAGQVVICDRYGTDRLDRSPPLTRHARSRCWS